MIHELNITIPANKISQDKAIRAQILEVAHFLAKEDFSFRILKKSLDARNRNLKYNLRVQVAVGEKLPELSFNYANKNVSNGKNVHIIGAGPAGYFAALQAIQVGLKPIIYERGKNVRERRRDLKKIHQDHIVDDNSNYCFGEGGAGTYSDGKLYTRSKKRGDTLKVMEWLVSFGAPSEILIEAHPHIGTNKLPKIIEEIRDTILESGGEIHFNSCLTDLNLVDDQIRGIVINNEKVIAVENLILATGHSARDIFELLNKVGIEIEAKNFALGVRIEHAQKIIDKIQYHGQLNCDYLPPAAYSLVTQAYDRGVYSFCMCPGGIIAPCATTQNEVVTNGWSPSKRNNPFANSGIVVEVRLEDVDGEDDPLKLLNFQKAVEQKCWEAAGKSQKVPAQRMIDFIENRKSTSLPETSYQPGLTSINLNDILPEFVIKNLRIALKEFGKKMKGYLTNEAVLHAPESRTSSPVRIPRDKIELNHTRIKNLYPCAEGAGYAGGIVSAAVDGIRCIDQIVLKASK